MTKTQDIPISTPVSRSVPTKSLVNRHNAVMCRVGVINHLRESLPMPKYVWSNLPFAEEEAKNREALLAHSRPF